VRALIGAVKCGHRRLTERECKLSKNLKYEAMLRSRATGAKSRFNLTYEGYS